MVNVHPQNMEQFHIRLLLKHKRGPKFFVDLRGVNEVVHDSIKSALIALELCG